MSQRKTRRQRREKKPLLACMCICAVCLEEDSQHCGRHYLSCFLAAA